MPVACILPPGLPPARVVLGVPERLGWRCFTALMMSLLVMRPVSVRSGGQRANREDLGPRAGGCDPITCTVA